MRCSLRRVPSLALALAVSSFAPGAFAQATGVTVAQAPQPSAAPRVVPPRIVERVEPAYPQRLLDEPHGDDQLPVAHVELEVTLDASGKIRELVVLASGGELFDAEAMRAVRAWKFAPAQRDGKPIPSRFHVPLNFVPPAHAEPIDPGHDHPEDELPGPDGKVEAPLAVAPEAPPELVDVHGRRMASSRGASDYRVEIGQLAAVPRRHASELLKLAPSVFLLRDGGGEGHADRIYLRGFDAREGQDIELSVGGVPINESGNFHGNGFADLNFIIPEVVGSLRVLEGPFDPRQGNYAVAGSADYTLGLARRGLTAKATYGSFDTTRLLLLAGPENASQGTFAAAEVFRTGGFGQNRDAWRGRAMGQYEGAVGERGSFRLSTAAYGAEYHSGGVLRASDVEAGRKGFYDTNDPNQGGSAARFHVSADVEVPSGSAVYGQQVFAIYSSHRTRENFTGFLLDPQDARQQPHPQRGDLLDLAVTVGTFGARGHGKQGFELGGQKHALELGYLARLDVVGSQQQRVGAATNTPYATTADYYSKLGDVGVYGDLDVHLTKWLALRGGARADLFVYDVDDLCAVRDVSRPSSENPPGDASCLSQQRFGDHREPNQRSSTASLRAMPRAAVLVGPFTGFTISAAYGQGIRSIDPSYVSQDVDTPFAAVQAGEAGVSYAHSFDDFALTAQSVFFVTHVDRDQIFSETEGRNVLGGGTTRLGWAGSARLVADFVDVSTSLSMVRSRFDDTGLLVPYVPDVIARTDAALFGSLPLSIDGAPLGGRVGLGASFVGRRALPYGQRSDLIFVLDAAAALSWKALEFEVAGTNLLDLEYRQSEFNYVSDFSPTDPATLVPARHFAAGPPLGVFASLSATLGGS